MMTVDVVIPTRGTGRHLAECLASLCRQTRPPDVVYIVADGIDVHLEGIEGLQCLNVELRRLATRRGFAAAVNNGIRSGNGDVVVVLNDDTVLDRLFLEKLVNAAEACSCASLAPVVRDAAHPGVVDSVGLSFSVYGYGNRRQAGGVPPSGKDPFEVFGACGAAALYRRSALVRVGLFREDFFFGFEDLDLACRLRLSGERCFCVPEATVLHRRGSTIRAEQHVRLVEAVANSLLTAIECIPGTMWKTRWRSVLRFYLGLMWQFVIRGYGLSLARGLFTLAIRLPGVTTRRASRQQLFDGDVIRWDDIIDHGPIAVHFPDSAAYFYP